jgi:hypothetical protein
MSSKEKNDGRAVTTTMTTMATPPHQPMMFHRRRRSLLRRNPSDEPAPMTVTPHTRRMTPSETTSMGTTLMMGAMAGASTAMISSLTMPSISSLVVVLVLCNISISSQSLNGSICSIILCNVSNGAICSKLCFF